MNSSVVFEFVSMNLPDGSSVMDCESMISFVVPLAECETDVSLYVIYESASGIPDVVKAPVPCVPPAPPLEAASELAAWDSLEVTAW